MNGQEAVFQAVTSHKEGRTLAQIYERYLKETDSPILPKSVLGTLGKLIIKGCVERASEGRYRRTGKPFYSNQGRNKKESIYITAIKARGGKNVDVYKIIGHIHKAARAEEKKRAHLPPKPDQRRKRKVGLFSALAYLSLLKGKGLVTQNEEGGFGLPVKHTKKIKKK